MVRVSIDVPALRGVVSDINDFKDKVFDEWMAVGNAAGRALTSTPSLSNLGTHTQALRTAASDLQVRIDLAILYNTGADGPPSFDSPLSYPLGPGQSDSAATARYMLGQEIAELAQSMYTDGAEDWQVELFNEQMERWVDDDHVMASTFSTLGPDGTIYVTTSMGNYAYVGGDVEAAQRATSLLQEGLETASKAWTENYAERFGRGLVDAAVNPDTDKFGGYGTTEALSLLMYESNYSGAFLTAVADGIDEVERLGEVPRGFWSMRGSSPSGVTWLFPEDARETAFDPMVSVFGSMADQPGVALDWWDDPERQEYWIKERTWAHDDFRSVIDVLDAASTHPSNIDPPLDADGNVRPEAQAAAELASATITYLADNPDFGFHNGGWFGGDHWGGESAGADLAHIISTYMPAVDHALDTTREAGYPGAGQDYDYLGRPIPVMPFFDRDALSEAIQVASRSDAGFAELRSGVSSYNNLILSQAATNATPPDFEGPVGQALAGAAEIEGFFAYNVGGGNIEEAAARDARRQAWVDLGSDIVGAIPVPGGQVVGFLADQAISVTADAVSGAITGNAQAEVESGNALAEQAQNDYYLQAIWTLDEAGALPYQQNGAAPVSGPGVEDGVLMSPADIEALPEDQRAEARDAVRAFATSPHGLQAYINQELLETAYKNPFLDYFEDGEPG